MVSTFLWAEDIDELTEGGPERLAATGGGLAEQRLQLRAQFLDGGEGGRVGRQVEGAGSGCPDRPPLEPHCLVANVDPALMQQVFDVPKRQWVFDVHHDHQPDHLRRAVEAAEQVWRWLERLFSRHGKLNRGGWL